MVSKPTKWFDAKLWSTGDPKHRKRPAVERQLSNSFRINSHLESMGAIPKNQMPLFGWSVIIANSSDAVRIEPFQFWLLSQHLTSKRCFICFYKFTSHIEFTLFPNIFGLNRSQFDASRAYLLFEPVFSHLPHKFGEAYCRWETKKRNLFAALYRWIYIICREEPNYHTDRITFSFERYRSISITPNRAELSATGTIRQVDLKPASNGQR